MNPRRIADLAAQIEAAVPSGEELDKMREEAETDWNTDYNYRCFHGSPNPGDGLIGITQRFQDSLAQRLTAAKGWAGCIRVLCEEAEGEAESKLAVFKAVQDAKRERFKSGGKL